MQVAEDSDQEHPPASVTPYLSCVGGRGLCRLTVGLLELSLLCGGQSQEKRAQRVLWFLIPSPPVTEALDVSPMLFPLEGGVEIAHLAT